MHGLGQRAARERGVHVDVAIRRDEEGRVLLERAVVVERARGRAVDTDLDVLPRHAAEDVVRHGARLRVVRVEIAEAEREVGHALRVARTLVGPDRLHQRGGRRSQAIRLLEPVRGRCVVAREHRGRAAVERVGGLAAVIGGRRL